MGPPLSIRKSRTTCTQYRLAAAHPHTTPCVLALPSVLTPASIPARRASVSSPSPRGTSSHAQPSILSLMSRLPASFCFLVLLTAGCAGATSASGTPATPTPQRVEASNQIIGTRADGTARELLARGEHALLAQ